MGRGYRNEKTTPFGNNFNEKPSIVPGCPGGRGGKSQASHLECDSRNDRAISVQQAPVVHIIILLLLRQAAHSLRKAVGVAVLLIKGIHPPLLLGCLGTQRCQLPVMQDQHVVS